MKPDLNISLVQTALIWENPIENIAAFDREIESIDSNTDLIVLPEMFTTGFSMKPEAFADDHLGSSFKQMQKWAEQKQAAIYGSLIITENGKYYNRAYFVFPDGRFEFYDKRHLFRMAKEDEHYTAGSERKIIEYKGWKILPLICYDLRFPTWSRNNLNYDLILYVANWPERRSMPWKTLLRARAIENLSYVIGVNRIGEDGNGIEHSGDSALIDFKGDEISQIKPHTQQTETIKIDAEALTDFREKFPAHLDADRFEIH